LKQALRRAISSISLGLLLSGFLLAPAPTVHAATCPVTYVNGRPTIAPTAAGPGSGKTIGFDVTHGQTAGQADWVIDGGFSDMACALAGQGYAVEEIRAYPLTESVLGTYDAVVIPEPNIPFTDAEEQSLEGYVAAGGGLLLVGDHYQADRNYNTWDSTEIFNGFRRGHYGVTFTSPAYNYNGVVSAGTYTFNDGNDWLASAFGFRFRFNAMDLANTSNAFGPGDPADPDDPGILPPSATYGITAGVNRVATYAGATISIVDPTIAMGVVYPNQGTLKRWNNAQSNDPVALYTDSVGTPAGGAATFGGRAEGAYVVVAKPGAGKVAAAGDSSLWEDKSPRYRREADGTTKTTHDGWLDSDHDTLGINVINWLTTPDSSVGIDPALQQAVTPEPYNIFALTEPLSEPWANPPSGYRWYDATTFRAGAYTGSNQSTPPPVSETWNWESVSLNAYPNNNLAVFLNVVGLTPNSTNTNQAYMYAASGGTQISFRYFRNTNEYKGGSSPANTEQTLQVDSEGKLQRWEFWQLNNATSTRAIRARVRIGSTNKATTVDISQKPASGSYGYLTVESSLGYNNGAHAALFTRGGALDTAVQIKQGADTTITLAPGDYQLEIQTDDTVKRTGVPVTIVAGQTLSLAQILGGGGGNPNASLTFSSVPENSYPGNRLAIYLDGQALAANTGYATDAFATVAGGAQAVSRRYNRTSSAFDAATEQMLTADGTGEVHRWEFWELDATSAPRSLSARAKLNGTETDVQEITQAAGGAYGYLTVESALGFANGLHAALFRAGATLDTAVWVADGADTTITLAPGTYTLEVRNDAGAVLSDVSVTIAEGQTLSLDEVLHGNAPEPGWFLNSVPARVYPGNKLALRLDAQGLAAGATFSTRGYVYVTGPGTQISKRLNRSTGAFVDGLTYQSLTTNGLGEIHRWEFWELNAASSNRGISARLVVDGTRWATENLQQVATGSFGYLIVPQSLGYSDGLHAALFTAGGVLDTTAWIAGGADTTITLPAGEYTVAIANDAGVVLADVAVTITAGQTTTLGETPDVTPPTITGTWAPEPNAAGWNNGPVTVTFTCADEESGVATCTEPVMVSDEGDGLSVTGTAVDNDGNSASVTVTGIRIDQTAPVTTAAEPAADGTVVLAATDALSGVAATYFTVDGGPGQTGTHVAVSGDGTHTVSYWSVDLAGNAEAPQSLTVALDQTPPTITAERTEANEWGWNNGPVTVTFACADAESGIAACTEPVTVWEEGAGQSVTGTAVDHAGNQASLTVGEIHIDLTAPDLAMEGARVYGVDEEILVTCTASDGLSGLAEEPCAAPLASGTGAAYGVGEHSVTVTAVDKAGNTVSATAEFSVAVTYESLIALTERWGDDEGLLHALVVKLEAAQEAEERGNTKARDGALEAFVNQLEAQSGKKVAPERAAVLVALAEGLMK
jgi:hypothetical protein